MKNQIVYKLKSKISIQIEGKNMERFIKRLSTNHIEMLSIKYHKYNIAVIQIYKEDYEKVLELKSIYDVSIVGYGGLLKIKKKMKFNRFLLVSLFIGLAILLFLTHVIFKIEVVHTNIEIRKLLIQELENHGIKEKSMRKNFHEIEKIKKEIVEKYKDKIEWLEIENVGTKYVVRVELRKIPDGKETTEPQNIVAKKSAIIKKVTAKNGEIVRGVNDYVKAGDIIISGQIHLNEEIKGTVKAEGEVYGEVWYQTTVEYPLHYYEEKETGVKKNVFTLQFLNREIGLFDFKPFPHKVREEKTLLKHPFLPFSLTYQKQKEVEIIDETLTEEQAVIKAENIAREKMISQLNDKEYIINQKSLFISSRDSKIVVEVFFSVYENITDVKAIPELIVPEEE